MKKTAEQEVQLKLAIRDVIVRNPLISGGWQTLSFLNYFFHLTSKPERITPHHSLLMASAHQKGARFFEL
jgi:hypothetical protein